MLPINMPTLRAVTYFFHLGDLAWLILLGAVLLVLWKFTGSSDWGCCAMIAALTLVAPHMHPQDLVLLLIVVGLILVQSPAPPSVFVRWSLFAFMLSQSAARVLFAGVRGNHWPVIPMGCSFCWSGEFSGDSPTGARGSPSPSPTGLTV